MGLMGQGDVSDAAMTDAEATGLGAGWEALKERARLNNLAKLPDVEVAVRALLEDRLEEEQRAQAVLQAHKIAGSAGTFGLPDASVAARALEKLFGEASLTEAGRGPVASEHLQVLRRELDRPAAV
jgi:HPt (histidine-containing phosphotransfer) domain-containing protein